MVLLAIILYPFFLIKNLIKKDYQRILGMFEILDIKLLITIIGGAGAFWGGFAVLKATVKKLNTDNAILKADVKKLSTDNAILKADVKKLETDNKVIWSKMNKNSIEVSNLNTEKDQFLKRQDLDGKYVTMDAMRGLEKQIQTIIDYQKKLESKLDLINYNGRKN